MEAAHSTARPGDSLSICGIGADITGSRHSDRTAVGFKFHTPDGIISYVCDTDRSDRVVKAYEGSRILILPVTRPTKARIRCHLCTEDAVSFAETIRPELILFAHMGVRMIQDGPEKEAAYVESRTGIRTVAAKDLMNVRISENIDISMTETLSRMDK
jgi:phosphoribosyl 1,2-cyclic phosphodiesterase